MCGGCFGIARILVTGIAVLPEEEGKAAKRFTVNFFSTDGQYEKERAAAKQPKKKMRPNPLDKVRAARS